MPLITWSPAPMSTRPASRSRAHPEEATRHFTQVPLTNACGPSSLFAAWELTTPISPRLAASAKSTWAAPVRDHRRPPRDGCAAGVLVISATHDAQQFSVREAAKSVACARDRFRSQDAEARIRHLAIESGHDFNAPMREAMYGWVEKWLRGRGDGDPIKEPHFEVEPIRALRCYPDPVAPRRS